MSNCLRHNRTDKFYNMVIKILNKKYNGNIFYYNKAEEDAKLYLKNVKKLYSAVNTINSSSIVYTANTHKITNVNLENKELSLIYTKHPEVLLSYNLEYLSHRRLFPYSIMSILDKGKNKDLSKIDQKLNNSSEINEVINWVRTKVLGVNFMVSNVSLDRSNGVFSFSSTMVDSIYGSMLQHITAKIPDDKMITIDSSKLKDTPKNLAKNYESLFNYFMMFGLTEFNATCNCPDYIQKYSKRLGIGNYFCPHILYAMSQVPYYMMYVLFNS